MVFRIALTTATKRSPGAPEVTYQMVKRKDLDAIVNRISLHAAMISAFRTLTCVTGDEIVRMAPMRHLNYVDHYVVPRQLSVVRMEHVSMVIYDVTEKSIAPIDPMKIRDYVAEMHGRHLYRRYYHQ